MPTNFRYLTHLEFKAKKFTFHPVFFPLKAHGIFSSKKTHCLVSKTPKRSALACPAYSLYHLDLGNNASADPGSAGSLLLLPIHRTVSKRPVFGRGADPRGAQGLGGDGVLQPGPQSPPGGPINCRPICWQDPGRFPATQQTARNRPVYGRGHPQSGL